MTDVQENLNRDSGRTAVASPGATSVRGASSGERADRFAVLRALRPVQWVKNLLLFAPLILSHRIDEPARVGATVAALVAFCLCASAVYVLNDLRDREADRAHPVKRRRPFASGALSAGQGCALAAVLVAAAFAVSLALVSLPFTAMLATYLALTTAYSLWLKQRLLIDVFVLAGLYTFRILAGGVAAEVEVSPWLRAFSMFFFLSLAFAKRYAELARVSDEHAAGAEAGGAAREVTLKGRAYRGEDLAVIAGVGPTSGYLAVLVLALYINNNPEAAELYRRPDLIWFMCPLLLYWITRVWFFARRKALSEDPILFALTDHVSLLTLLAAALVLLFAWVPL